MRGYRLVLYSSLNCFHCLYWNFVLHKIISKILSSRYLVLNSSSQIVDPLVTEIPLDIFFLLLNKLLRYPCCFLIVFYSPLYLEQIQSVYFEVLIG